MAGESAPIRWNHTFAHVINSNPFKNEKGLLPYEITQVLQPRRPPPPPWNSSVPIVIMLFPSFTTGLAVHSPCPARLIQHSLTRTAPLIIFQRLVDLIASPMFAFFTKQTALDLTLMDGSTEHVFILKIRG